jgi:L-ectoine synthase
VIIRILDDLIGTSCDVHAATWNSRRLLLKRHGMGFSLHDTIIHAGTETFIHYKHHLEAVYCIEGEGQVERTDTGEVHAIRAGTAYALNGHEPHLLRARTRMRMICVFNPPLTGEEVHDADGVYPVCKEDETATGQPEAATTNEMTIGGDR